MAETILAEGMPYKDAWDVKGPLPYYVYALAQWMADHEEWGIRLFELLFVSYGMIAMWWVTRDMTQRVIASWTAAFLLGVWYYLSPYMSAQPYGVVYVLSGLG